LSKSHKRTKRRAIIIEIPIFARNEHKYQHD
jgi:hypothetical protein